MNESTIITTEPEKHVVIVVGDIIVAHTPAGHNQFTVYPYTTYIDYNLIRAEVLHMGEQGKAIFLKFKSPKTGKEVRQWFEVSAIKYVDTVKETV